MDRGGRILIVEDEAISAMWLEMELQSRGYIILRTVPSGSEAIAVARDEHPDIALMDIRLAGPMDGIEAARAITELDHCEIIFMSGYSDQLLRLSDEPVRSAGYLSKPIQIQELERLLEQLAE